MPSETFKQITIKTFLFSLLSKETKTTYNAELEAYAQRIIIDYFSLNSNLTLENCLKKNYQVLDLCDFSTGLIINKIENEEFQNTLTYLFKLLLETNPLENHKELQAELFTKINKKREEDLNLLQDKLNGNKALSLSEIEEINLYNTCSETPINIINNRLDTIDFQLKTTKLSPHALKEMPKQLLSPIISSTVQSISDSQAKGIIMDAPLPFSDLDTINEFIIKINNITLTATDIWPFFLALQALVHSTLSYKEKNILLTYSSEAPSESRKYIEYQTLINIFLENVDPNSPLMALKIETSFQDMVGDAHLPQQEHSIMFNRIAITLLENKYSGSLEFYGAMRNRFSNELNNPSTQELFHNYMEQRLPLLWILKYEPEIACRYFLENNSDLLYMFKFSVEQQQVVADFLRQKQMDFIAPLTSPHDRYYEALQRLISTYDDLKTKKINPKLLKKILQLIENVKNLKGKKTFTENIERLTEVLTSTNSVLTGGDVESYLKVAHKVHDIPSSYFNYLGLLMVLLGVLAVAAGIAISFSGVGVPAGIGLSIVGGGVVSSSLGMGLLLFSKVQSSASLEEKMENIIQDSNFSELTLN